ncbi:MAG: 2-dehydropantoate 2-reductase [Pseudomonadota bacterium]|uniref:ketopantoate reductase family protein n=1 Tax=Alcanivorax sp. TaxID=1872427 RepID=UPI0025BAA689|nr:2-dehydropantoate 2-reductase [Alcanivorax sp.]MED5239100.1 2-dehydropantoate 2-reductase [Pseudomonadota bacterium]MEE3321678.1 2-dehydropantoate 2-reductase [Pseudomonadota bacterium]
MLAYHASMITPLPHWYLLGAGNMGTLAAWYLTRAGHTVTVIKAERSATLEKNLQLPDGTSANLSLPVVTPEALPPSIDFLLVAVKTPYSAAALAPVTSHLHTGSQVLRLQNGLGALDGLLPDNLTVLEAVSTSAVKGQHPHHQIVAENLTWLGGQANPPDWLATLQAHWPNLQWADEIHTPQWQKLVANAVINPLTAIYDVPNGEIVDDPELRKRAERICAEADRVLQALDPTWPAQSIENVLAVARATAGNTSSMRADRQRGAETEIEVINGWIVKQANRLGLEVPENQAVMDVLKR